MSDLVNESKLTDLAFSNSTVGDATISFDSSICFNLLAAENTALKSGQLFDDSELFSKSLKVDKVGM